MPTPEERRVHYSEPVYATATPVYNISTIGRVFAQARVEGLIKGDHWPSGSYPPQTAPGLHETIQSQLARVRATVETVNAQLYADGTVNSGGG